MDNTDILKKKELLKSPWREDGTNRAYKSILLVPAGTEHDSGYMHIAIIGAWEERGRNKYEVCALPDDIHWLVPEPNRPYPVAHLRTDCLYPSGILQFWGRGKFYVGDAYSSTEITFVPENK